MARKKLDTLPCIMSFRVNHDEKQRIDQLLKKLRIRRSEFLRACVEFTERHAERCTLEGDTGQVQFEK